ncbi:MAG: metallophosphoesterase [Oscillospiraceae bacterium]|nr:metallophosphoesterase [Oscillospiraceae bacterium]
MLYILIALTIASGAAVIFLVCGIDNTPEVTSYAVRTDKLTQGFRLVLLSDLHSCRYGDGQRELLQLIDAQSPDMIMLTGDIVDDRLPKENSFALFEALTQKYPCFYVTGNHELWRGDIDGLCEEIAETGVTVLRGESVLAEAGGGFIRVCGVDYALGGDPSFAASLGSLDAGPGSEMFSVLLSHNPKHIGVCLPHGFDLILSGHMHGGQWRVPGLINGVLSPPFEIFPKYAGGKYVFDGTVMVVSRGLAKESTRVPRVYNRPEVVVIDVKLTAD